MKCPRCESVFLEERDRNGITIDICQQCRGIWLDRGELERLISVALNEQEIITQQYDNENHHPKNSNQEYRDNDHRHPNRPRRKESWFDSLMDIFD